MIDVSARLTKAILLPLGSLILCACTGLERATLPGDASFTRAADAFVASTLAWRPSLATSLGVHDYDDRLEDLSRPAIDARLAALTDFAARFQAFEPDTLSLANQLDREFVLGWIGAERLQLETIRPWEHDPDTYQAGITSSAFYVIKRAFAPAEDRLRVLIARERAMPGFLRTARQNLNDPPRILTEIAIEQVDGNRGFFENDVPAAFASVTDPALRAEFDAANGAVLAALDAYKTFLVNDLLPRSHGSFALGEDALRGRLRFEEGLDEPLDRLLEIAQDDLHRNQEAFARTAADIDPSRPPAAVLEEVSAHHVPPARLLAATQESLDAIRGFIVAHELVTIPPSAPVRVEETPPYMRSTTSASMETPGPFETRADEAFYNMTLPDPAWPAAEQEEFMRQWYDAMISNVSVHEAYPGHYIQFLYAPTFPSALRKVFGANTNIEGWAHYCEQMMLDEGFHAGEPEYRLAQLQDALLRDARCIVGIRMHARGMSVEEAAAFFEREAYQPAPVALSEAKRGTTDATYGYYTLGKLMIRQLRDDLRAQQGAAFSLRRFHDDFLKLGPLPLPLIRRAMGLGEG